MVFWFLKIESHAYKMSYRIFFFVQLLLIERKTSEVPSLLAQAGHLVETWNGSVHQKEYLKLFFLVLQVSFFLSKIFQILDESN